MSFNILLTGFTEGEAGQRSVFFVGREDLFSLTAKEDATTSSFASKTTFIFLFSFQLVHVLLTARMRK